MNEKNKDLLSLSVRQFIEETSRKQPTPGGGSVAGVVGGLSVALAEMSLNYSKGKKALASFEAVHEHLGKRLRRAGQMFDQLVAEDVAAYEFYVNSMEMEDGEQKTQQVQLALAAAINVPREVTKLALAVLGDLLTLADKCNAYLLSDLKAAAALAATTATLSHYNVQINTPSLADRCAAEEILEGSRSDVNKARTLLETIEKTADAQ
jgi:formiminotetrahydrofolate cyclodeaminase